MNKSELKEWANNLDLTEIEHAAYIGVPLGTYRKWANGQRQLDAAPLELVHLLQLIQTDAPTIHANRLKQVLATLKPLDAGVSSHEGEKAPIGDFPDWLTP